MSRCHLKQAAFFHCPLSEQLIYINIPTQLQTQETSASNINFARRTDAIMASKSILVLGDWKFKSEFTPWKEAKSGKEAGSSSKPSWLSGTTVQLRGCKVYDASQTNNSKLLKFNLQGLFILGLTWHNTCSACDRLALTQNVKYAQHT